MLGGTRNINTFKYLRRQAVLGLIIACKWVVRLFGETFDSVVSIFYDNAVCWMDSHIGDNRRQFSGELRRGVVLVPFGVGLDSGERSSVSGTLGIQLVSGSRLTLWCPG